MKQPADFIDMGKLLGSGHGQPAPNLMKPAFFLLWEN